MKVFNYHYLDKNSFCEFVKTNNLTIFENILIMCFSSLRNQSENLDILKNIEDALPNAILVGTSTDSGILNEAVEIDSFIVSISIFENSTIKAFCYANVRNQINTGKIIARKAKELKSKAVVLLGDGLNINGDFLIDGMGQISDEIVLAGGLSSSTGFVGETVVFFGSKILLKAVITIHLIGKNLLVYTGKSFNWVPLGPEFTVTKATDNRLFLLNDITPCKAYEQYLGAKVARNLPRSGVEFPLLFFRDGHIVGRAATAIFEDGSIAFAGNIHEGEKVQFGFGNIDAVLADSINIPKKLAKFQPDSVFVFSCMARKEFLGDYVALDTEDIAKVAPSVGFFTYGEFFYDIKTKKSLFFNETITVLAIKEIVTDQPPKNNIPESIFKSKETYPFSDIFSTLLHFSQKTSFELNELNRKLQLRNEEINKKQLEAEQFIIAQAKTSAIGEMLSMIAHQWRQPLSLMSMVTNKLRIKQLQSGKLDNNYLDDIKVLGKNIEYLSKTIDDFRDFFRPSVNTVQTTPSEVSDKLESLLIPLLNKYFIKFTIKVNSNTQLNIYESELVQVLMSLIVNAVDAIAFRKIPKGHISLWWIISKEDNNCKVIINDNGGGIEESVIDTIFEPYTTTKSLNGTGLGLYMSKTIICKHFAGDILGKNIDGGAQFVIDFPLVKSV